MIVVELSSQATRKVFLQEWILSSFLYFLGLAITRGTVAYRIVLEGAVVLGFAQIFGGTIIRESNRFSYFHESCGYPYIQVIYQHFFGRLQDMELNPASPSRSEAPAQPWWGAARWRGTGERTGGPPIRSDQ